MSVKLDQALVDDFIGQGFGLAIAHENANYTPTAGTPFVQLQVFQNEILAYDIAHTDDVTGVFQFILRYPEGAGAMAAKTKAANIFDAYPLWRRISYSGQSLTVTGKSRPEAVPEDGWFKVVGQISFRAFLER